MVYAVVFGIIVGILNNSFLNSITTIICEVFIRAFKCLSLPLIFFSIVTVLFKADSSINKILKKTVLYTFTTTIAASSVACFLYLLIDPRTSSSSAIATFSNKDLSYTSHIINIIPTNIFAPYMEHNVISILLMGIVFGFGIRFLKDENLHNFLVNLFKSIHALLIIIIQGVVKILPIGIFAFISSTIIELNKGLDLTGIIEYLSVIILSNLIQGIFVLPIWLKFNNISPVKTAKLMFKALSLAFFSKSSAATLPVTIQMAEENLKIKPQISKSVLPLCTTINMNGCAAFIFTTVIYLMNSNGITTSLLTMTCWIFISTIAAVGNAGVPMGCFFLSASLLASMDVPIVLLGIILPFYSIIDMVETTLNVWSDTCVAIIVDKKIT